MANKLLKDAISLYVGRGSNLFIGLLSTLIYGVVFQNKQIALISLFEMTSYLFVSFGFSWSSLGIVRFGKEEYNEKGAINYSSSIRLSIIVPIFLASALLIIIFRDVFINYIGIEDRTLIAYLIANIGLLVFHEHITSVLTASEQHSRNVVYFVSQSLGKLFILLLFYKGFMSINAATYLKLHVYLLTCLAVFRILFLKKSYLLPIERVNKSDITNFWKYVTPQVYGFAGVYLINWMDVFFIRKYCTLEDLGSYQFLYSIFLKLASFAFLFNTLFFPRIVSWKSANESKIARFLQVAPPMLLIVSIIIITFAISIYQSVFGYFFGVKYADAYPSFNLMLCTIPLYFVTFLFIPVLNSYDRVHYIQRVNIASASCNLLIDALLISKYGLIAAALGTFVAYLCQFILLMDGVNRIFKLRSPRLIASTTFICLFVGWSFFNAI